MKIHDCLFAALNIPKNLYTQIQYTGSAFICDPPVLNTDVDFLLLIKNEDEFHDWCLEEDFETNYGDYPLDEFRSYKRGNVNLIITTSSEWYRKFQRATMLAKELNLLHKPHRIALFNFIFNEVDFV